MARDETNGAPAPEEQGFAALLGALQGLLGRWVQVEVRGGGLSGAGIAVAFEGRLGPIHELGPAAEDPVVVDVDGVSILLPACARVRPLAREDRLSGLIRVEFPSGLEIALEPLAEA